MNTCHYSNAWLSCFMNLIYVSTCKSQEINKQHLDTGVSCHDGRHVPTDHGWHPFILHASCNLIYTLMQLPAMLSVEILPWLMREIWKLIFNFHYRADSRCAPSQWETALLCNDVSHWLGANLESALLCIITNEHTFSPGFKSVQASQI